MNLLSLLFDSAYDSDAVAFFARAGVIDPQGKKELSTFVKGIKSLGLWDSMTCWPLCSRHNRGTGTTVYSLGGQLNLGTLTNGPTWGPTGVSLPGTTAHMAVTSITPISLGFVAISTNAGVNARFANNNLIGQASSGVWCLRKASDGSIAIDSVIASTARAFWFARVATNDAQLYINGTSIGIDTAYTSYAALTTLLSDGGTSALGTWSVALAFSVGLTTSQQAQLYSLLRETLASGLL
jgi:hypothetical protein